MICDITNSLEENPDAIVLNIEMMLTACNAVFSSEKEASLCTPYVKGPFNITQTTLEKPFLFPSVKTP